MGSEMDLEVRPLDGKGEELLKEIKAKGGKMDVMHIVAKDSKGTKDPVIIELSIEAKNIQKNMLKNTMRHDGEKLTKPQKSILVSRDTLQIITDMMDSAKSSTDLEDEMIIESDMSRKILKKIFGARKGTLADAEGMLHSKKSDMNSAEIVRAVRDGEL